MQGWMASAGRMEESPRMVVWMDGSVDGWMKHGWADQWVDEWMVSWMAGLIDGQVAGKMDGWKVGVSKCVGDGLGMSIDR